MKRIIGNIKLSCRQYTNSKSHDSSTLVSSLPKLTTQGMPTIKEEMKLGTIPMDLTAQSSTDKLHPVDALIMT
ncbi:hypothetical protein ACN42_g4662 [Penicillium freii]|uniref:Uncharacterized protein n=1 Tax=Penicillium freii TaxID=48697 RepID=A0A101MKW8_PENFR|nr:hypothetical protein ACN42_g4662 [Penicillium freii]